MEGLTMRKSIAYGTAVLVLSALPSFAQVGSGTSGQGGVTPVPNSASQPPATGGATDQGGGSRPGTTREPDDSTPAQPNAPTGSGARAGKDGESRTDAAQPGAPVADQSFVIDAAQGGMAEVELGRLAVQKASSDRVKQFGQRMVTDHGKANEELKSVAEAKKISLPTDVGAKHKATHDRLAKLSGPAFDQAYIQEMVTDHQQDITEFRKESENGKDAAVKAFASKALPTLEEHMKMVQEISQSLGRSAVGTSGTNPAPR